MSLGTPASGVVRHVLTRGAGRVTNINATTRKLIRKAIGEAIDQGLSPREAAALVARAGFGEYRAELIARTELMFAYNQSALTSYRSNGVGMVQAVDGDEDEECAARDGQVYSVLEAEDIEDHPNGTLDWIPIT